MKVQVYAWGTPPGKRHMQMLNRTEAIDFNAIDLALILGQNPGLFVMLSVAVQVHFKVRAGGSRAERELAKGLQG